MRKHIFVGFMKRRRPLRRRGRRWAMCGRSEHLLLENWAAVHVRPIKGKKSKAEATASTRLAPAHPPPRNKTSIGQGARVVVVGQQKHKTLECMMSCFASSVVGVWSPRPAPRPQRRGVMPTSGFRHSYQHTRTGQSTNEKTYHASQLLRKI